ncbi:hypothetical protein IGL98_003111 [Enterococcus sp. DIV0840]|uniref:transposase n=1 Tax=Enterococcus TaxID=1350 RepID=UPI001A8CB753|nr:MULTISPECIES: transposase [Enterococcus]MBO0434690.1 transposase [Enterococcus sp. DIV0849a]MBO0475326.1 transposase [Enterococcus ureasiticus]
MTIIQQPTFIDIEILIQLDVKERHAHIFSPIDFYPMVLLFQKETHVGAPITLNYEAAIRAMITRYIEGIPSIKALVQRLNEDVAFKLSLGFLYSERVPSEASFCRIMKILSDNPTVLVQLNDELLAKINQEFQIYTEIVAIDATSVDGHSKPKKTENEKVSSTTVQKEMTLKEIRQELPIYPSWGVKANSQGKHNYWFGYKTHYAVTAHSQYILAGITTSAFVADVSVAIPLMMKVADLGIEDTMVLMDKGYDAHSIYEKAHELKLEPIIDLKRVPKNDGEIDRFYAPTCLLEYSYKYDSFDKRYSALKFTKPETHCRDCPLRNEGLCQTVIKIKQSDNFRKYSQPARGTRAWRKHYKERTSVERVNAYLKDNYSLNSTNYFIATRVVVEHQLIQLAYNLKTFCAQLLAKKEAVMSF